MAKRDSAAKSAQIAQRLSKDPSVADGRKERAVFQVAMDCLSEDGTLKATHIPALSAALLLDYEARKSSEEDVTIYTKQMDMALKQESQVIQREVLALQLEMRAGSKRHRITRGRPDLLR